MSNNNFYDSKSLLISKYKQIIYSLQQIYCFCQQNFSTETSKFLFSGIKQVTDLVNKKIESVNFIQPYKTDQQYKQQFQKKFNQFKFLSIQNLNDIKYIAFWCPKHGAQQMRLNSFKLAQFACLQCHYENKNKI